MIKIKNNLILLIIISILVSFSFQGVRGLYSHDEGRYTECAREMNASHNYMLPTLNLKPHLSKPPVTYWAIAGSLKIFGNNEFAARFPNSLSFIFTVILIFLIGKILWNKRTGVLAGLIYSTSIFPFIGLNFVTTDTILTFTIWLYIFFFVKTYFKGHDTSSIYMWCAMGLSFLTKGTPALLPFLGIVVFLLLKDRKVFKKIFVLKGIVLFLLIGLSWYLIIILKQPDAFDYFIGNELIGRIKGVHHRNSGIFDWIIYIPILLFGLMPWCFYLIKVKVKDVKIDNKIYLLSSIILFPLIIFCIVKSRLPLYILPLFPAISLLSAFFIIKSGIKIPVKYFITTGVVLIILRLIFAYIPMGKNERFLYNQVNPIITEKNNNIGIISTRHHYGLNFYFNKIIPELKLDKKLLYRFYRKDNANYIIIFDKNKLSKVRKLLKNFKIFKLNKVYLVKLNHSSERYN